MGNAPGAALALRSAHQLRTQTACAIRSATKSPAVVPGRRQCATLCTASVTGVHSLCVGQVLGFRVEVCIIDRLRVYDNDCIGRGCPSQDHRVRYRVRYAACGQSLCLA